MDSNIVLKTLIENKQDREFFSSCISAGTRLQDVIDLNDKLKTYKNLFKANNIKPSDFKATEESANKAFFNLQNTCDKLIIKSQAKKKMRTFFSNKHASIINKETANLFCDLIELKVSEEFFNGFRKKVSAFKTAEKMNEALSNEIKVIKEWNDQSNLIKKIQSSNTSNISKLSESEILFEVHDFKTAKELGTQMWCICREEETFIDHKDEADRVFFKYNLKEFVNNKNSMTAYIVKPNGMPRSSYYKDDSAMTKEEFKAQNISFEPYTYNQFKDRLSEHGISESDSVLITYKHGFNHYLMEGDFEKISKQNLLDFLVKNPKIEIVKKIYDDRKELFKEEEDVLTTFMIDLENNFSKQSKEIFFDILGQPTFKNSEYFKENSFIDLINSHFYLDPNEYERVLDGKGTDLQDELLDVIRAEKKHLLNTGIYDLAKNKKIDLTQSLENEPKLIMYLIKDNLSLLDSIFGGEEAPEKVLKLIEPLMSDASSSLTLSLKSYAKEKGLEFLNEDAENEALIRDMVKRPNTLFVKIKKIEERNIKVDYESSLSILKTLFLDEDLPFERYESTYIMDDVVEAKMNQKTKEIVLTHNLFDNEARVDFFSKVNEHRKHSEKEVQKIFDDSFGQFIKEPKIENTKNKKRKLKI